MGRDVICDDPDSEVSIRDVFQLGPDLQFLLRFCLTIHLGNLKNHGNSLLISYFNLYSF